MPEENEVIENAPVVEDNTTQVPEKETVGDIISEKEKRVVPESALIEYKKQNKELKREINDLKKLVESGASKKEVSADISKLAEDYNVDKTFLEGLVGAIKAEAKAEMEEKLKPIQEKEKKELFERKFADSFNKAIEEMPEFKTIADIRVIKALALDPENRNKTLEDLFEETYGKFVTREKKTLEANTPGGGKNVGVDFERCQKDAEYRKSVLKNPALKKIYNENMIKNIKI
ncbi:MAG: hypothetical protein BWY21_01392 [Parcubacteria group bacterium ADurb.Bin216]|nr:MAG: hypothetical protein BWY21_01392 [Parcubacteria group bacterium ADurb.Bin216]